ALVTLFILFSAFASSIPQDSAGSAHLSPGDQSVGFPEIAPRESLGTLPGDVENPFIAPNNSPGTIERAYTFPFSQTNVTVRANASVAVYEGARNGVTYTVAPHGSPIELLAPGYYQAFIDDAHQDPFYTGLLCDLSSIRSRYSLTDDEYLELTTNFVQSFPYDTEGGLHPDNPPRFPVQTFVDGTGDCDDKSLLLAGLLSREGYDIVLFLFIPEHHMAIGVRNSSFAFRNTGYMFIETTGPVLVGEVPSRLAIAEKYDPDNRNGNLTIANSTPLVIRVGTGTKGYTSASETAYILGARKLIDSRIAGLRPGLGNCTAESRSCKLAAEREYNQYALLHNYIVKHSYDRKGLYRYLRGYDPARTRWSLSPVPDPVYGASSPLTGLFGNNRILSWRWQDLGQQVAFLHAPSLYYNSPGFWRE
ncbi:MAG: hypothetical protein LUP97_02900, partial [Methanoregula sp.]|nr:hypothetical protein [Methanoregula sp.]